MDVLHGVNLYEEPLMGLYMMTSPQFCKVAQLAHERDVALLQVWSDGGKGLPKEVVCAQVIHVHIVCIYIYVLIYIYILSIIYYIYCLICCNALLTYLMQIL